WVSIGSPCTRQASVQPLLHHQLQPPAGRHGAHHLEAVGEVEGKHRGKRLYGDGPDHLVALIRTPAVLPDHELGGDAAPPPVAVYTSQPAVELPRTAPKAHLEAHQLTGHVTCHRGEPGFEPNLLTHHRLLI